MQYSLIKKVFPNWRNVIETLDNQGLSQGLSEPVEQVIPFAQTEPITQLAPVEPVVPTICSYCKGNSMYNSFFDFFGDKEQLIIFIIITVLLILLLFF